MKKRNAFIAGILSLLPLGQPVLIKSAYSLLTVVFTFSIPEKANAGSDYHFYFNRATKKINAGDYSGGIADLTKTIELNPNLAMAYYNRGIAKYLLRNYQGAIEDHKKSTELNPNYAQGYINLAAAHGFLGDMKGYCSNLRKASSLGHKDAAIFVEKEC